MPFVILLSFPFMFRDSYSNENHDDYGDDDDSGAEEKSLSLTASTETTDVSNDLCLNDSPSEYIFQHYRQLNVEILGEKRHQNRL